jgi:hypothetical protein
VTITISPLEEIVATESWITPITENPVVTFATGDVIMTA